MKKQLTSLATALVSGIILTGCCCTTVEDQPQCPEKSGETTIEAKCEKTQCDQPVCPEAKCDCPKCDCPKAKGDRSVCPKSKCDKSKCDKVKCDKTACPKAKCDQAKCDQPCPKAKGGKFHGQKPPKVNRSFDGVRQLREKCPEKMTEIDKKFIAAEDELHALAEANGIDLPRKKVDLRRIRVFLPEEYKALQEERGKISPKEYGQKLRELTEKTYQR